MSGVSVTNPSGSNPIGEPYHPNNLKVREEGNRQVYPL
jgi:hypothetical protein